MSVRADKLLRIYLQDHFAAATAGVEVMKRSASSNEGTELGNYLQRVIAEASAERETLLAIMRSLDVEPDRVKQAAAWAAEKAGRLKFNGQLTGYSPLSRVIELEGLQGAVAAKLCLWRTLRREGPRLGLKEDFDLLIEQGESQLAGLAKFHLDAVDQAFPHTFSGAE